MPALFVFLLKVNLALIIFYLGYYLVLRRLTFYTLNRVYLVTAIVFSSVYPLINLNNFSQRHEQIVQPVQKVMMIWQAPSESIVKPIIQQPLYWHWAITVFWIVVTVLAIRLLVQFISLYKLHRQSTTEEIKGHIVRIVNKNISPFSFWQSIYINPDNLNTADLESVLLHEQVHIKEWHTLDILLTEINVIFYWFNPGVWFMKEAVRENIEFITDRKVVQKGIDSKQYQYSLLNVGFTNTASTGIANHFNISTLKKRIVMMNKKRSSNFNLTRYAFLIPAVIVLLLIFSFSKAKLVKNSNHNFKDMANTVVKNTLIQALNPVSPAIKKSAKINDNTKHDMTITKTTNNTTGILTAVDTSKKEVIQTSDNYVIDGIKATRADKERIASSIKSIYILPAEQAAQLTYKFRNTNKTIFIFTRSPGASDSLEKYIIKRLLSVNKTNSTGPDVTSVTSGMSLAEHNIQLQQRAAALTGGTPKLVTSATMQRYSSTTDNGFSKKAMAYVIPKRSPNVIFNNDEEQVSVLAQDSITSRDEVINLYGKAQVMYKGQTIQADYIEYNKLTKSGYAKGKVTITSKDTEDILTASNAAFSLNNKTTQAPNSKN